MEKMKNLFNNAFPFMSDEMLTKLRLFGEMLREGNEKFNLTAISGDEEMWIKHFYDSLLGEPFFPLGARVAEIGSGGGFPSVPLMIARPDLGFTLIEATGKKCAFLGEVCKTLGLNARIVNGRAEEVARLGEYRERFDAATARAVASMNTLAEYCLPFVKTGGVFVAYKGADDETAAAEHAFSVLGGKVRQVVGHELPEGMGSRKIVVVDKTAPTPAAYPRGRGKERKQPL